MKSDADIGGARAEHAGGNSSDVRDCDTEFGGPEERKRLEKKLLRKIDARMSILIVIYILNYVSLSLNLISSCDSEATGGRSKYINKFTNAFLD
jgi:hypothetical protein